MLSAPLRTVIIKSSSPATTEMVSAVKLRMNEKKYLES